LFKGTLISTSICPRVFLSQKKIKNISIGHLFAEGCGSKSQ